LCYICVTVLDSGHSAFAPLAVADIVALSPTAASPVPAFGQDGELVLIEGNPLLDVLLAITLSTNANSPQLTLFGNPGTNFFIQYTTNLSPPIVWTPLTNFTMTGLLTNFGAASPTDQMEFFRAYYIK
jgi:hypothetical protein